MKQPLRLARDAVRTQLWPLPVVSVVLAVVAGVLLPRLDAAATTAGPGWLSGLVFGGDAGAARTVLDAVSSSLITVTSLTFSLTVVTLQLASGQYSPRLLRTFTSDVFVQATLGVFLSTFIYSLTVLRTVRSSEEDGRDEFVPRIAVTVSFVLAVLSVIALVLFLAHLARQIRVETMLRDVHADALDTIDATLLPAPEVAAGAAPGIPADAGWVLATSSGFLNRLDEDDLLALASSLTAVIVMTAYPGRSLVKGTPVGRLWGTEGSLDEQSIGRLREGIGRAVHIGYERTAAQDVGYALRQLTDVANKALSPGINDPTTAVHALGHISAVLCELSERDLAPVIRRGSDGAVRVVLHRPDLAALVDVAVSQPRRYGAADPQVMSRLFALLGELAWRAPSHQQPVVVAQLSRLRATVAAQNYDAAERDEMAVAAASVDQILESRAGEAPAEPGHAVTV